MDEENYSATKKGKCTLSSIEPRKITEDLPEGRVMRLKEHFAVTRVGTSVVLAQE